MFADNEIKGSLHEVEIDPQKKKFRTDEIRKCVLREIKYEAQRSLLLKFGMTIITSASFRAIRDATLPGCLN